MASSVRTNASIRPSDDRKPALGRPSEPKRAAIVKNKPRQGQRRCLPGAVKATGRKSAVSPEPAGSKSAPGHAGEPAADQPSRCSVDRSSCYSPVRAWREAGSRTPGTPSSASTAPESAYRLFSTLSSVRQPPCVSPGPASSDRTAPETDLFPKRAYQRTHAPPP